MVHVLDSLEASVVAESSGEGFRENHVPFLPVDYLKHTDLTIWFNGRLD